VWKWQNLNTVILRCLACEICPTTLRDIAAFTSKMSPDHSIEADGIFVDCRVVVRVEPTWSSSLKLDLDSVQMPYAGQFISISQMQASKAWMLCNLVLANAPLASQTDTADSSLRRWVLGTRTYGRPKKCIPYYDNIPREWDWLRYLYLDAWSW